MKRKLEENYRPSKVAHTDHGPKHSGHKYPDGSIDIRPARTRIYQARKQLEYRAYTRKGKYLAKKRPYLNHIKKYKRRLVPYQHPKKYGKRMRFKYHRHLLSKKLNNVTGRGERKYWKSYMHRLGYKRHRSGFYHK